VILPLSTTSVATTMETRISCTMVMASGHQRRKVACPRLARWYEEATRQPPLASCRSRGSRKCIWRHARHVTDS
jgi:hypothetical protein